jgi:DNA-directed RNA polymerase subunit RPC12/RpoP
VSQSMRQMSRTGEQINQAAVADFGDSAQWYLTVRCASSECRRLIAFQKALYAGDQPNLRFAITGEPTVRCPHCGTRMRVRIDQIKRRRIVVMQ